MTSATIPFSDIAKNITVEITLTGLRRGRLRFKLAALVFRFGAFIAGTGLTLEVDAK